MTQHKCSAKVPDMYGVPNVHPCMRSATVERGGKRWCWQHDPERVKTDARKRRARREAKMDREAAKYARIARNARLGQLVTPELAALRENRVRAECLEIVMGALDWYGRNCPVLLCHKAGEALDKIERLLAELEPRPEEEAE